MQKYLSSFWLKIIAIISMTFDHLGKILLIFYPSNQAVQSIEYAFSIIGRIAFPLFLFLLIEGFYHTQNIKKYFLRLGAMLILIYLGELIIGFVPGINGTSYLQQIGNIFVDLILSLLFLYLINSKEVWKKGLSILPISYFILCIFIQNGSLRFINSTLITLTNGFLPQYSFVTPIILILFVLYSFINNFIVSKSNQVSSSRESLFLVNSFERRALIYSLTIATLTLIMYAFTYISEVNLNTNFVYNTYFILSIIPILLYNGKLGLNNKFLKVAYYLYYPFSICIIYLIVFLTTI